MSKRNMQLDVFNTPKGHNNHAEDVTQVDNTKKDDIPWYLIDSNSTSYNIWDSIMTTMIIYCQIMGPLILVFPDMYMEYDPDTDKWAAVTDQQHLLVSIERTIDIFYCIDIILSFFKWTRVNRDLKSIALNYLEPSIPENFIMDMIGTLSTRF